MGRGRPDHQRRGRRRTAPRWCALALAAAWLAAIPLTMACRPDSITGARDQLGRGEERTVSYRVPVVQEDYGALRFLQGVTTRLAGDGLIVVPFAPDSVPAPVGPDLSDDGEARVRAWDEVDSASMDLGELEEGVAAAEIRTAPVELSLRSSLSVPLRVVDPFLAAVRLEADGQPAREPSGELDLEEDDEGRPLTVPLAEAPGDSLALAPDERIRVEREGAPLVERIVDRIAAGERIAAVLGATARVDDADRGAVEPSDFVVMGHRLQVGLDLVLPDTGIVLQRTEIGEGVGLSGPDARDVEDRLIRAAATLIVDNGVPFRVETRIAWLSGRRPDAEVFADPERVSLDPLSMGTGAVGDDGRVEQGRLDTLEFSLTGAEVKPLLEEAFTAGVRIRLLPPGGSGRRGALTVDEDVEVDARASVDLRAGTGG